MPQKADKVVERVRAFLREATVMSLATVDDHGRPHAANVYFASDDDLNLFLVSDPRSTHIRHLAARPDVAVTIYTPQRMWQQVRGVQIHGTCEQISPDGWADAWTAYTDKMPHMLLVEQHIRACRFYRVQPHWIRWTDNSVHFGYKVEFAWPGPTSVRPSEAGSFL